jgi:hypothetical protein
MEKAYAIILNEEVRGFILVDGLKITGAWLDPELPPGRTYEYLQYKGDQNPKDMIMDQLELHPDTYVEYDPDEVDIEIDPTAGRHEAYQTPESLN